MPIIPLHKVFRYKNHLVLMIVFLFYWFLLTPIGSYKYPDTMQNNEGFHSVLKIDPGDDAGYYAYLRSGVIDGDFDFFNEKRYYHFDAISTTGYTENYWYIGQALLWLPFFLIGHAIAWFYSLLGYAVAIDGYSFPYLALTFLGSNCEVFFGLALCYALLKRFFPPKVCLITTLSIFTATSLPYFTFIRNRMSHTGDVLVSFLFLLFFFNFRERQSRSLFFFVLWGILGGMLFNLRYNNILYLAYPFGFCIQKFSMKNDPNNQSEKLAFNFFIAACAFILTILPQLATWYVLNGKLMPITSHLLVYRLTLPSIIQSTEKFLYGPNWGIFLVEPIWLLGFLGLIFLFKKDRCTGGLSLLVFLGMCVLPVVNGNGVSFGQRYMLSALPILALGLAQLMDTIRGKFPLFLFHGLLVLLSGWVYLLLVNYVTVFDNISGGFVFHVFKKIPQIFSSPVSNLILQNTYPHNIFRGNIKLIEFRDFFFLIIFPVLLWGFIMILNFFSIKISHQTARETFFQFRAIRNLSIAFLFSMGLLAFFIILRHPSLPAQAINKRLQISAASSFLKDFPKTEEFEKKIMYAEKKAPQDEINYLIRGDVKYMKGLWQEAKQYYLKAIALNESSTALLQLQRIDFITGRIILSIPLLKKELKEGDSSGAGNLWFGIYNLDKLDNPEEAIFYFKESLKKNPDQKQAPGLRQIIDQYNQQKARLKKLGNNQGPTPILFIHMLNTIINKVRLEYPLFSMGGYFLNF